MQKFVKNLLVILLAGAMLLPALSACKKDDVQTPDDSSSSSIDRGEVVIPDVTVPPVVVETSPDGKSTIVYEVSGIGGGIVGTHTQTPGASGTSAVTAEADLGYRFKSWSDGVTEPTRKGDTCDEGTKKTIYAVFEVDYLEMPVMNIMTSTGDDVKSKDTYIDGTISITNCPADSTLSELAMQIKGRGNFSWSSVDKKSYKIKLSASQKLLGLGEGKSKTWALLANHCDQALLRNYLTFQLSRSLSGLDWAPDCTSVEVFLNGEYRGVYLLIETIKVDDHRIAISEEVETGTDIGYLLQMTNNSDERYKFWANDFNFDIKSDLSSDGTTAGKQKDYIQGYINDCWDAVIDGRQSDVEKLIDIDSLIDTYLVEEFNKNLDVGYDSFYLYKDAGGKLTFGPVWDFDLAFGNSDEHKCMDTDGLYTAVDCCNHYHSNEWYTRLMQYDWFRAKVAERWKSDEAQAAFGRISGLATETAEGSYNSFCRNFDQWQIFGRRINRETDKITSLQDYKEHYQYLAKWIDDRFKWLNDFIGSEDYNNGDLGTSEDWDDPWWWNPPVVEPIVIPDFSGGDGSKESPYLISSADDFVAFTNVLSGEHFDGKYFLQTADLDLSAVNGYSGAGSSATFSGIYNGGGHTINANIRSDDGCIFPYVKGLVMNLVTTGTVENNNQAAGICRSVRNGGALINCASLMSVTSTGGNAGGLSPSTQDGNDATIVNCFFAGSVQGAGQSSPINCWLGGRGGMFSSIYFVESVDNGQLSLSEDDTMLTSNQMKGELAGMLNGNFDALSDKLSAYGVGIGDLVSWQNGDTCPEFVK